MLQILKYIEVTIHIIDNKNITVTKSVLPKKKKKHKPRYEKLNDVTVCHGKNPPKRQISLIRVLTVCPKKALVL